MSYIIYIRSREYFRNLAIENPQNHESFVVYNIIQLLLNFANTMLFCGTILCSNPKRVIFVCVQQSIGLPCVIRT